METKTAPVLEKPEAPQKLNIVQRLKNLFQRKSPPPTETPPPPTPHTKIEPLTLPLESHSEGRRLVPHLGSLPPMTEQPPKPEVEPKVEEDESIDDNDEIDEKFLDEFLEPKPVQPRPIFRGGKPSVIVRERVQRDDLPSGYESLIRTDETLDFTEHDLPWLKGAKSVPRKNRPAVAQDVFPVRLIEATLADSQHTRFYLASLVRTPDLIEAANAADLDHVLYTHAAALASQGLSRNIAGRLENPITDEPIYYFKSGGNRIYFVQREHPKNKRPIYIKIAACRKEGKGQELVFSVITTDSKKAIKQKGRL